MRSIASIVRGRIDSARQRIELEHGDLGRTDTRPALQCRCRAHRQLRLGRRRAAARLRCRRHPHADVGDEAAMAGIRGAERAQLGQRTHFRRHGRARPDRRQCAAAGCSTDKSLPISDEALSIEIETSGTTLQPVAKLPPIRDADLSVRVTGRTARVYLGRGTVEVAPGRKLNIASGAFEVPDTHPEAVAGLVAIPYRRLGRRGGRAAGDGAVARHGRPVLDPATSRAPSPRRSRSISRSASDDVEQRAPIRSTPT